MTRSQALVAGATFCVWIVTTVAASAQPARVQMPRQGTPSPPRDTSAQQESQVPVVGTATITGRVVAADTGQPLRRATITAMPSRTPPSGRGGESQPPRGISARTGEDGKYVLSKVPAGDYTLMARRAGYVDMSFGQLGSRTPPRRITVADGATLGPLTFDLVRGGVITGRVMDDAGEPAERAMVRVLRQQRIGGEMRLLPVGQSASTDDLGHYRLFGLAPGEYVVMADPSNRGMQFGPRSDVQGVELDVIGTYGPGTVDAAAAERVLVQAALETAMDIQLVAARVSTVRGRVLNSKGEPLSGGFIRLQSGGVDSFASMGGGGPVQEDGTFELQGVAPGSYTLVAQAPMRGMGGPRGELEMADIEAGTLPLSVEGEDLAVVVTTGPGSTARGRVVVEGDASALAGRELRVSGGPATGFPTMMSGPPARGRVAPDLTVTIAGLRGRQVLNLLSLPDGWWIKEIRVGGQDALLGFDFGAGRTFANLEIVVSARATGLTGTVSLPTGATAEDYGVVLFSEDEDRWATFGPAISARVVRPDLSGRFTMPGVRPGSYYVVAVPAAQAEMSILQDPEALRALAAKARTVEIKEGEQPSLTLTLVER
ncbi:MAG: carboxypeptidase regulatory-like domain-containing protein [Acidobacteria bacterium]|nr:carboxypeptidase regulatory-like domain-containing protein [Acidobacteriota bacterium]